MVPTRTLSTPAVDTLDLIMSMHWLQDYCVSLGFRVEKATICDWCIVTFTFNSVCQLFNTI